MCIILLQKKNVENVIIIIIPIMFYNGKKFEGSNNSAPGN